MRDTFSRILAIAALGLAAGTAIFFFRESQHRKNDTVEEELLLYRQVREVVREYYVDDIQGQELLRDALKGMLAGLDPYSEYLDKREKERLQEENLGRFVGIGVVFEPSLPSLTISFPQPGSPAEKAGLRVGDRIVAVDGTPVEGTELDIIFSKVRGEEGTTVHLKVIAAATGNTKEVEIIREPIREPTVFRAHMLDEQKGIGYLLISGFSQETVTEFDQAMEKLQKQGVKSLIVDLRFNPGGVLDAAATLSNRFVKEGRIVATRGRNPQSSHEYSASAAECFHPDLPLLVLINGSTGSAAEVFAGAIQDYRRGTLIGTTSYGKGVVQSLKSVDHGKAVVKLTTSFYYTPANRNFEKNISHGTGGGIEPDLIASINSNLSEALRQDFKRFDIPEIYREEVEQLKKKKLTPDAKLEDPQLDAAVAVLRGETPNLILK